MLCFSRLFLTSLELDLFVSLVFRNWFVTSDLFLTAHFFVCAEWQSQSSTSTTCFATTQAKTDLPEVLKSRMKASLSIQIKNRIKNKGRETRNSVVVRLEIDTEDNLRPLGNEALPQYFNMIDGTEYHKKVRMTNQITWMEKESTIARTDTNFKRIDWVCRGQIVSTEKHRKIITESTGPTSRMFNRFIKSSTLKYQWRVGNLLTVFKK